MKSMWPIFTIEIVIYQAKANFDEKIRACKGFVWE